MGFLMKEGKGVQEKSLYKRLGGYDLICAIVDAWFARMAEDSKFAFFPAGLSDFSRKRARQLTADFLCEATGGPCYYFGLDIKTAHQGLGITEGLWDVNIRYLSEVLDQLKVAPPEKNELLNVVKVYKESVVEK